MSKRTCDGCGRRVRIGGNRGNLWQFDTASPEGITLELTDGTEHFLCFACVDALPEEPTAAAVDSLPPREESTQSAAPLISPTGVTVGLVSAIVLALIGGVVLDDLTTGLMVGGALGAVIGLLVDRAR